MKGKLHKMVSGYILSLNGDIDDPYAIVNEELAKDHEWHRLSLKNCQAIELGYDLDELAKKYSENIYYKLEADEEFSGEPLGVLHGFKDGFQKALEILGDKKFSEEDVRLMLVDMASFIATKELKDDWDLDVDNFFRKRDFFIDKQIQSLQQTEWEVEIVTFTEDDLKSVSEDWGKLGKPKLDKEGCLILKRI